MKELSLDTIKKWLRNEDWRIRAAAMNACQGKDVPFEIIEKGLQDEYWHVRVEAMNACQRRDVPIEIIEKWLRDEDCDVRAEAFKAAKRRGITIPPTRTFEPPKTVYKKCLLGVIVEAEIPKSAHVRGGKYFKCRASEAIITGIIGDTLGEKIGISDYDYKTTYQVGDHVVIDNFDYSDNECSTGFHFFCLRQEAELYQV